MECQVSVGKARYAAGKLARTLNDHRRPKYLFSGLTKYANSPGAFTIVNHDNLSADLYPGSARDALRRYIDRIVIPPDGLLRVIGNPAAMGLEPGGMIGCGGGV